MLCIHLVKGFIPLCTGLGSVTSCYCNHVSNMAKEVLGCGRGMCSKWGSDIIPVGD